MSINILKTGSVASICLLFAATSALADKASFKDLSIGQEVEIIYKPNKDGEVVASQVKIGKSYKLTGQIEALDKDNFAMTVLGIKFQGDFNTRVTAPDDGPMEFSDLRLGQGVKIKGDLSPSGVFKLTKIDAQAEETSMEGVITAINEIDMSLTVLGVQGIATHLTTILDKDGVAIEFSELRRGQLIQMSGARGQDGNFKIGEIEQIEDEGQYTLEGKIDGIDEATGKVTVLGIPVDVKKSNKIEYR